MHLTDLLASKDAPSVILANNKKEVMFDNAQDYDETNKQLNHIFKEAQNLNFPKIEENDATPPADRLNQWKKTVDGEKYISLNDHQTDALRNEGHIWWMKSNVCPEFFNSNPRVGGLNALEYKFWLGMVDPKCGYIRSRFQATSLYHISNIYKRPYNTGR